MRILHIIPSLNKGGAERLVLNICNELTNHPKVEVMLITFRAENAYQFLTETINWKVIPSRVSPSLSGKMNVNVLKLQKTIEAFNPDIIHSHLFETEIILSQINFSSTKYFVHFHDNMVQFENMTWKTIIAKHLFINYFEKRIVLKSYKKRIVCFIGISQSTFSYLQHVLPTTFQKIFFHNSIDISLFHPLDKIGNQLRISMIGSLVDKKGQALAIETLSELRKRGIDIHLDLLGEGPDRHKLESLVEEYELNDKIHIHGNVDHPEFILNNSFLYIHTAKYEPFGLVILEAMACGLPVVCTDGKGNRDLIQEGANGFMVWERDPKLLADKIELLINDVEKRKEMGIYARKFSEDFGIEQYVNKLIELYKKF